MESSKKSSQEPGFITIWGRAGISFKLTKEEMQKIHVDPDCFSSIMTVVLSEERYEFDGETYFPEEASENEELYTDNVTSEFCF
ncbi:hypothetical protein ABET08_00820 [Bacillus subtilis]